MHAILYTYVGDCGFLSVIVSPDSLKASVISSKLAKTYWVFVTFDTAGEVSRIA